MDATLKVLNAIENREQRIKALQDAEWALEAARKNLQNANVELARQLKNKFGIDKRIAWGGWIYTAIQPSGNGEALRLNVCPADFHVLEDKRG